MKIIKQILILFILLLPLVVHSQEEPEKKKNKTIISTKISFGFNYVSGNTNKVGANTSINASAKDSLKEFSFNSRYLINRTNKILDQREITTGIQYDYKPFHSISPFARAEIYSNSFQKIKIRGSGFIGLKYTFLKRPKSEYSISGAALADIEKYTEEIELPVEDKYRISLRLKLKQTIMENIYLLHETYYIPLIKSFSDFRMQSNTSINFKINKVISFSVSYNFDYNSKPIDQEVKKTDNKLYANLTLTF